MMVKELAERLDLSVLAGHARLEREVTGGYVGDLLSCVMAGATAGSLWVTVQGHPNVVAVASLAGISGVVVTEGARVEPGTLQRADEEGIPILATGMPSFETVVALSGLGVRGKQC